jgi:hypothetical protein
MSRSRTAQAKNEDREARNRRTDASARPSLVRPTRARVTSRSVTAFTDRAAREWGTSLRRARSET